MPEPQLAHEVADLVGTIINARVDPTKLELRIVDDYGADSMDIVDVVERLEKQFSITIPHKDVRSLQTFGDILTYVLRHRPINAAPPVADPPLEVASARNGSVTLATPDRYYQIEPSPSVEAYGCRLNAWSVDELFSRYEAGGFLDPAKKGRLSPFLNAVKDNWSRGLTASDSVLQFVSNDADAKRWATVATWRTTNHGWLIQHLVSTDPCSARQVMLATLAQAISSPNHHSVQFWFQPSKRMPGEIFGTIPTGTGPQQVVADEYAYFALLLSASLPVSDSVTVHRLSPGSTPALVELVHSARGQAYCSAEELDGDDLDLERLDELYRKVGLRRYRRVYAAELLGFPGLAGALIAYRGPLGLNFSFLENRAELITVPTLTACQAAAVAIALVAAARPTYADFEPGYVPVVASNREAPAMTSVGATLTRTYCRTISPRTAYAEVYEHIRRTYDERLRQRSET